MFLLLLLFVFLTYLTHSKRELHLHCSPQEKRRTRRTHKTRCVLVSLCWHKLLGKSNFEPKQQLASCKHHVCIHTFKKLSLQLYDQNHSLDSTFLSSNTRIIIFLTFSDNYLPDCPLIFSLFPSSHTCFVAKKLNKYERLEVTSQ